MTTFIRFRNKSTNINSNTIIKLIEDRQATEIRLFASPIDNDTAEPSDGASSNFPLLSALARYIIPAVDEEIFIVFDADFLTAARSPRAAEIKDVLDAAVKSEKVSFSPERAPFTSSLEPKEARSILAALPTFSLDNSNRKDFWQLLSNIPEAEI